MRFKITLTVLSVLAIFLFFRIGVYNNWLNKALLSTTSNMGTLSNQTSYQERMLNGFGSSYALYDEISVFFNRIKIKKPVLLLPPAAYMQEHLAESFDVVEPSIFYYFTGYWGVWYDSPGVQEANFVLTYNKDGKVIIGKIKSRSELNGLLATYKNYKLDR